MNACAPPLPPFLPLGALSHAHEGLQYFRAPSAGTVPLGVSAVRPAVHGV